MIDLKARLLAFKSENKSQLLAVRRNETGDLYVYGAIGFPEYGGTDIKEFATQLEKLKGCKTVNVYINSPGGDFNTGIALYNQLKRLDAKICVFIDGSADSAASIVAMAGDEITIAPEATMMIHEVWVMGAEGNADALVAIAEHVKQSTDAMKTIYTSRTGIDEVKLSELLKAETTLTASMAVELKFADKVENHLRQAALNLEPKAEPKRLQNFSAAEVATMKLRLAELKKQH